MPRRNSLSLEPLEGRDLLSASPLPVLLVIADQQDFYYREYADTRAAVEAQGVNVVVAASTTNPSTPHANTGQPAGAPGTVVPDVALGTVDAADYSAIAFVGGWGASMYQYAYSDPNGDGRVDNFYANSLYNGAAAAKVAVNDLINDFLESDKPVAGICHGVTVLAWARVDGASPLAGKQVAVPHLEGAPAQFYASEWHGGGYHSGQRDQVVANGGRATAYSGAHGNPGTADDVIVDGRIITAENPESAALFGTTLAEEVLASLPAGARMVGGNLVVTGTPAADTVYLWSSGTANRVYAWVNGTSHGPFVLPAGGHVKAFGGAGNDQVFGTDLYAGLVAHGGGGHDLLVGGAAGDTLDGGDGCDRVWGGPGDDVIRGGAGDDYLYGREGNDVLVGGDGNDTLDGFDGRDLLIGGLGTDRLLGGDGDDVLVGGRTNFDHDDAALGGLRGVWLAPGDLAVYDDGAAANALVGGAGNDWLLQGPADGVYLLDPGDRVTVL
ncbi:DJ-1/PfpI family protein [Urbifossiella limnaea]|uniref:RTX-I toxin determinant A from serotypes 1/9 n=1 Tax=Urbifossiella limnaea TaxID=2528023 RepID=A0A517XP08_9BACT|nr:DJ-1/PfpI family protein [Urbifossiella limnaea]QDU19216.1 RTX-I toxin determinant A from serotypes 1/9 [Urbifossiella limnaea]